MHEYTSRQVETCITHKHAFIHAFQGNETEERFVGRFFWRALKEFALTVTETTAA